MTDPAWGQHQLTDDDHGEIASLLASSEDEFASAFTAYLQTDRMPGDLAIFRSPELAERTLEAARSLVHRLILLVERRGGQAPTPGDVDLLAAARTERDVLVPLVGLYRDEATKRKAFGSPRARALRRLGEEYARSSQEATRRLLALVKEERKRNPDSE